MHVDTRQRLGKTLKQRILYLVALVVVVVIAVIAVTSSNSPARLKSQLTSNVIVSTTGPYSSHIVAVASILNKSLTFYSGDKIGVRIALTYLSFPGDPNSLEILSVKESDGMTVTSVVPPLPTRLSGSPLGIALTVLLVVPSSSYNGDLHIEVANS